MWTVYQTTPAMSYWLVSANVVDDFTSEISINLATVQLLQCGYSSRMHAVTEDENSDHHTTTCISTEQQQST